MRKDRRLNGWVGFASVIGIIAGIALLAAGIAVGVLAFVKLETLLKIDDLVWFVNQEGIIKAQSKILNGNVLKTKFLYLVIGCIIALIGLLSLIFSSVLLSRTRKRSVVRHKVSLIIFTLIPLLVAVSVGLYLYFEFKNMTDNIKYVCYGLGGVFALISLCNILGAIFGRSEKFMSNDNNKYAFDNSGIKNARANINNANQGPRPQQVRPGQQMQGARPIMGPNGQPVRPMPPRPGQPQQRPVAPGQARPMPPRPMGANGQPARPMPPRPGMPQQRPVTPGQARPQPAQRPVQNKGYCPRCGKVLAPGERTCVVCGYKIAQ